MFLLVLMSAVTIQESFFSSALQGKRHVTLYLVNGAEISGSVRSYDKYSVILESATQEQLVFKHSISAAFLCRKRHCAQCHPNSGEVLQETG